MMNFEDGERPGDVDGRFAEVAALASEGEKCDGHSPPLSGRWKRTKPTARSSRRRKLRTSAMPHAMISCTTVPCTSVGRKTRPD